MKDHPKYKSINGSEIIFIIDSTHDPIANCVLYHCVKSTHHNQSKGGIFYLYQDELDQEYAEIL